MDGVAAAPLPAVGPELPFLSSRCGGCRRCNKGFDLNSDAMVLTGPAISRKLVRDRGAQTVEHRRRYPGPAHENEDLISYLRHLASRVPRVRGE